MSMHLVECVRALDLPPSTKLALVAFADSADVHTRMAMPGFEAIQDWAGVSRARTYDLIAELKDAGLIRQESAGRRGRRATYSVFPDGCCALHRTKIEGPDDQPDDALEAARAALAASGVELTPEQLEVLAGVREDGPGSGSSPLDPNHATGSIAPGQTGDESVRVQPTGPYAAEHVDEPGKGPAQAGPSGETGSSQGPAQGGPLPSFKNIPLTPSEAGGTSCERHPDRPGGNCRACGTTSRQLAAKAKAAKAARRREAEAAAAAARREQAAATRRATEDVDPALRAAIREAARQPLRTLGQAS